MIKAYRQYLKFETRGFFPVLLNNVIPNKVFHTLSVSKNGALMAQGTGV